MFAGDLTMGLSLAGGAVTPGRWGHMAFAIDTTGTAKLFVDGAEAASGSFQGAHVAWLSYSTTSAFVRSCMCTARVC